MHVYICMCLCIFSHAYIISSCASINNNRRNSFLRLVNYELDIGHSKRASWVGPWPVRARQTPRSPLLCRCRCRCPCLYLCLIAAAVTIYALSHCTLDTGHWTLRTAAAKSALQSEAREIYELSDSGQLLQLGVPPK